MEYNSKFAQVRGFAAGNFPAFFAKDLLLKQLGGRNLRTFQPFQRAVLDPAKGRADLTPIEMQVPPDGLILCRFKRAARENTTYLRVFFRRAMSLGELRQDWNDSIGHGVNLGFNN
jgi:hypothetical protein